MISLVEFYCANLATDDRTHPQQPQPTEGKGSFHTHPHVYLKKERPVCISIEGRGDHSVKHFMLWCRGRTTTGVLMSSGYGGYETATPHVTSLQIITPQLRCPELLHRIPEISSSPSYAIKGSSTTPRPLIITPLHIMVNYFVVLLLGVVSLMAESTTGVLKSPGDGGYQSTTPPSYYATTTYDTASYYTEAPKYYTTKEPEYYTTTNAAQAYYTEVPKYYSAPSYYTEVSTYYTTKTVEYYTQVIMVNSGLLLLLGVESLMVGLTTGVPMSPGYGGYQTTTPASDCTTTTSTTTSYYTEASKYYTTNVPDSVPSYYTEAPKYYSSPSSTTKSSEYYTTTYAVPAYYTDAPKYYSALSYCTKAPAYHNTNEVPKNYSAPSYTTLTEAVKYYVASTFYAAAAPSYYAEPKYYTEAPVYYTTTYATLCYYYTEALK
ncbi:hypothetical protein DAPPUDRAFT_234547 [Daphnia pulex]|uniref:Uncharacterized protein n=1 Tax=Daphnia pulex TaxID=6669 RepID=E9FWV6_DAPPU|nr:hypothetical protein DAPPUDRAFT_234547 [Daphnia pulex]|eukprot:EFX88370.1 hypothetical protein DAPPUDRAFT_234547 [Daphnia pulex]